MQTEASLWQSHGPAAQEYKFGEIRKRADIPNGLRLRDVYPMALAVTARALRREPDLQRPSPVCQHNGMSFNGRERGTNFLEA